MLRTCLGVALGVSGASSSAVTCSASYPQACDSETSCSTAAGVWIPVNNATYMPPSALLGGRRYTIGQSDAEFATTIYAPNGGYCAEPVPAVSNNCDSNVTYCGTMGECFYRNPTAGRWFQDSSSSLCVSNCSDPLVFCSESRCGATFGCTWFVKTQSTEDECYCLEDPGIWGNPAPPASMSWIFWDQPASLPIFILACFGLIGLGYNVYIHNLRPLWQGKKSS